MFEAPRTSRHPNKASARRAARIGWGIAGVWSAVLLVLTLLRPGLYGGVWLVALQQLIGGRALGIATGVSLGVPKPLLLVHSTITDLVFILVLYPLMVFGMDRASRLRFIAKIVRQTQRQAQRYRRYIEGWGPLGLAAFVCIPLWGTGPFSGTVVGTLMEMRTPVIFLAVTAGNFGAIALWTLLFGYIHGFSETYGRWMPVAILAVILIGWLVRHVAGRRSGRRHHAPEAAPEDDAEPESLGP